MELNYRNEEYPHIKFVTMTDKEWLRAAKESFEEALHSNLFDLASDIMEDAKHLLKEEEYYRWAQELLLARQEDVREHE